MKAALKAILKSSCRYQIRPSLRNRSVSAVEQGSGSQTYTMYNSPSFDMNDFNTGPQEPSSLCLVCHNGVFSSLVNYPGPGSHTNENYDYQMNPTFWAMLDTDLTNEHPISFTYNPARTTVRITTVSRQLFRVRQLRGGTGSGSNSAHYPLYGPGTTTSPTTQFECATCHAVHDTVAYPGKQMVGGKSVGTQVFFLRRDKAGSAMCADCHINRL